VLTEGCVGCKIEISSTLEDFCGETEPKLRDLSG
jgi:hypothetical protein